MELDEMIDLFTKHSDAEYLNTIPEKSFRGKRLDLVAFELLASLDDPHNTGNIIAASGHDEIFLGVNTEFVAGNATGADVIKLLRCGVRWDIGSDCFVMFV
jgi:hypothetical protein